MNEQKMNVGTRWKPIAVMACVLMLSACGGGGGGSSSSDSVASPTPSNPGSSPTTGNTTTVTGSVTKGPVSGAVLELFEIDTFGQAVGEAVATGTTTADGNFSISVPANSGTLLVVARGGSFIDESDQEPDAALKRRIQLNSEQSFLSLLPAGQTAVAVTPFTTALVVRGRVLGGPDGTFQAKFDASKDALNSQAGFDLLATIPANPVAPAATATAAQKQYALLLGGLANLINNVAIQSGASGPSYDTVVAVTFDLVDGQFDGLYFGLSELPVGGEVPIQLPTNADFTAEVNRFRNNNFDNFSDTVLPSIEVTTFANGLPTANAGVDLTLNQNTGGQLNGTASTDPDSGLFFSWAQTAGTAVALSDPTVASPTFTSPVRLLDNETLTFSLTVVDTVGFTSTDTVNVQVTGAIPSSFYVLDDFEIGDGVGEDIDGGGFISLNPDGTGTLLADLGEASLTYTVEGNVLTLNFPTPLEIDDFDQFFDVDGDGNQEQFLVVENADTLEFTLVTDLPNGDQFIIREVGFRVFTAIDSPLTKPSEPYEFTDPVTILDPGQATPFSFEDGDQRTLQFNSFANFNTLRFDDDLYDEIFTFNSDGTGTTVNNGVNFTYTIDAAGSLNVVFANGESAKYTNLVTRPSGDVVASAYSLTAPLVEGEGTLIGDIHLSLKKNAAATVPLTLADAAGIYSGTFFDDDIPNANLDLRLNPDGTGSLDFDSIASRFFLYDFDEQIVFRSNFGVCWNVDANGTVVVRRAFSLNEIPNTFSSQTTPSFCAGLTDETTDFRFDLTQFDSNGTSFKHFERRFDNRCFNIDATDCAQTPGLDVTDFNLRITTRTPLTATPPVAALDNVQTPDETPVVIDLLANDVARDLAIDPTSVTLLRGPFFGTTSLNAANGQVTYTPNAGIDLDVFQYIVRDTAGNPSQVQTVEVIINPCAIINGQTGIFDRFTGDCSYSGLIGVANVATSDINIGPLPRGGVHKFDDSLFVGTDYNTDAALAAAGISQGGNGPSLNIAAGAVLAFSDPSAVVSVRRGSQINVNGTPDNPVIMTSQADIDSRRNIASGGGGFQPYNANQQWGGLALQGFGVTNTCSYSGAVSSNDLALSGECHLLADSGQGTYGGINNADSSGTINYLQVKHGGSVVGSDPTGGIALFTVGSGTTIANVEVYSFFGGGLQLIGGAANVQNYVGVYVTEDTLGIDEGYRGSVTNALLIQDQFSGSDCVVASGITDTDMLSPAQIDALITQGINSRPVLSNITCVVSAVAFDSGRGINFFDGAFGSLSNSIVTVPGADDNMSLNYCIGAEDRSLQGVQDLDLTIASNIFACPDKTDGEILPNLTPLDAFVTSVGNQFSTTLTPGASNPPPVAGTPNVLLEGSPLIYAVPQAGLQVDGSPTTVTPTGTFIGAAQQGAGDWTLGWTFGLHPGMRQVPLWYEAPIIVTAPFLKSSKGQLVTLDASQSVAAASPVTYQWNQVGGTTVALSNPTSASTTFTAPGAGTNLTVPGGQFDFQLTVTDANGLQAQRPVSVNVGASIPAEFYTVGEDIIPFQFNRSISGGSRVVVNEDNSGSFIDGSTTTPFVWTDTPTTFTIDFSGVGGLSSPPSTGFLDVSPSPGQETVSFSGVLNSRTYTLVSDSGPKKTFTLTESGVNSRFNITDNVALPDDIFTDEFVNTKIEAVVSVNDGLVFCCADDTASFPVNIETAVSTLLNPGFLTLDNLTFNDNGTGMARLKNQTFNWSVQGNDLVVVFADGEVGEYTLLFERPEASAIGYRYTKLDLSVQVGAGEFVKNNPAINWVAGNVPGIYVTNQRIELDNGTPVDSKLFYRLHPEGTGQLELENVDLVSGNITGIGRSSLGICWQLDVDGDLQISRTFAANQRFTGSRVPSLSTCSLLNSATPDNTLISFQRKNQLFDIDSNGQLITFADDLFNQCNPSFAGCDATVLELRGTFVRNFEPVVPFIGNPPLAVEDSLTASSGLLAGSPVHLNDLPGDSAIVPTTVTIEVGPANGTATVDGPTGDILYTSNGGFTGSDRVYYRVQDSNGNNSTIGVLNISVM